MSINSQLRNYLESNGYTESVEAELTTNDAELSEYAQMINWINKNDVKQMQQNLLRYYCNTLTVNEPMKASDILQGYHTFIKSNPNYNKYYMIKVLSIRNAIVLGCMLKYIDCMTKKTKSVNNEKSTYYWRHQ